MYISKNKRHIYMCTQVYKLLQPFMLCMSHKSTLNTIDELVQGYDTLPQTWRDKLTQDLPVCHFILCLVFDVCICYVRIILKQILMIWIMPTIVDWALL